MRKDDPPRGGVGVGGQEEACNPGDEHEVVQVIRKGPENPRWAQGPASEDGAPLQKQKGGAKGSRAGAQVQTAAKWPTDARITPPTTNHGDPN